MQYRCFKKAQKIFFEINVGKRNVVFLLLSHVINLDRFDRGVGDHILRWGETGYNCFSSLFSSPVWPRGAVIREIPKWAFFPSLFYKRSNARYSCPPHPGYRRRCHPLPFPVSPNCIPLYIKEIIEQPLLGWGKFKPRLELERPHMKRNQLSGPYPSLNFLARLELDSNPRKRYSDLSLPLLEINLSFLLLSTRGDTATEIDSWTLAHQTDFFR